MLKIRKFYEPSNLRLLLRSFLSSSRIYFYLIFIKNKFKYPNNIANENTDIILEGYPRSGNSYLYLLIKQLNPNIKISSHTHMIVHIKHGISLNKKIIVLIRSPLAACSSRLVFQKNLTPALALKDYIKFYSYIRKNQDEVLIINSDKMFSDNLYIIHKLKNTTYKKKFDISINQDAIFNDLKKENDDISKRQETLGYPNSKKNELKKIKEQEILSNHKNKTLLKKCQLLYDELKDN